MKQFLSVIVLLCFYLNSNAQISFEKGYFINNVGQKKECLINNKDWKNNPKTFTYKFSEDGVEKTMYMVNAKEFGIYNFSKYIRTEVDVDLSSPYVDKMSSKREPEYKRGTVYLKTLIEGNSNLYYYETGNLSRYFFCTENKSITPLTYKIYEAENIVAVKYNNDFRNQLFTSLKCDHLTSKDFESLKYDQKDLEKVIIKYNNCKDPSNKEQKIRKNDNIEQVHLIAKGGIRRSQFKATENPEFLFIQERNLDLGYNTSLTLGVELEYFFNFAKNKWAVSIEPIFQSYSGSATLEVRNPIANSINIENYSLDYKSLETSLGLKHYMFLNNNSKLFLNFNFVIDTEFNYTFNAQRNSRNYNVDENRKLESTFSLGTGYRYLNKYSLELRYLIDRGKLVAPWKSDFSGVSLMFGYTIF